MNCKEYTKYAEYKPSGGSGDEAQCLMCNEQTFNIIDGKHFCCLKCSMDFKLWFMNRCRSFDLDEEYAQSLYKMSTDEAFSNGLVKFIKLIKASFT